VKKANKHTVIFGDFKLFSRKKAPPWRGFGDHNAAR